MAAPSKSPSCCRCERPKDGGAAAVLSPLAGLCHARLPPNGVFDMRSLPALAAVLALASSSPALAATHLEQQWCLTWISLAGHFGPEAEREGFAKQYSTLYEKTAGRTDVPSETRSADAKVAMDYYVAWATEFAKASAGDPASAARMVADVMPRAAGCAAVVADDTLDAESDLPPELHDLLNGTNSGSSLATPM
jgi:hypothetical protein